MSIVTADLHRALLLALGDCVTWHSSDESKPIHIDLSTPIQLRLQAYMYSLVDGGKKRKNEFKAVLRVPGQRVGDYGSFEHSRDRLTLLLAYRSDLDVFVFWDAVLHPRFKNGGNVQVKGTTVNAAAALGWATQERPLSSSGVIEHVIACQSWNLLEAITERVHTLGGSQPSA